MALKRKGHERKLHKFKKLKAIMTAIESVQALTIFNECSKKKFRVYLRKDEHLQH